ncbi:MAG: 50S ribosomal protein L15 [Candidatus Portnoybacteria bacterium RIFCSPLOWO2_12_FULL_39_9]|uniref:Large ribosomal subunit protein uL15 n=1 Tax=Candidatus Portnoybacteria bacterium RIFCSPHIGHO2_12_FULL_38_9 TaxID=1801997 RepID=A0A1G2FIC8_9BACT|nr:MAG: 50S ribosomal protein L15 [Candidatus Portnoybacteria bacterium RBG_13_40_8]OGZ36127.1 MAG: 50S ribosomal protein L15 [Candidatus Portnoybacteria bacterium RIFCSPHIGHO2_02_FULL_39_12]OGZ37271.1 MAG: 50S ribosomal protein L15 [Candidatus Portnoybacteria bacterium RIFCSPHIGHO2_12_FULL_38_9]OGZ38997.1 MAG: 50S ribosomal protein L15 [Candidatus Portnoybacteria bacterium RIFCSPLOWO2_01_FULL_38_39]OGZ40665.1 MAG: 50S ribosomal protein L15 [Candidatus Portnoybacteria bacterium RIFCSPLOWO2_12_F
MQLHQLTPIHQKKFRKRVGRGGKRGTYSGRGIKGQKSRAGKKPRLTLAGGVLPLKRFPKQRGAGGKTEIKKGVKLSRLRQKPVIVNLKEIEKKFKDGEIVSPQTLLEKGLVKKRGGRMPEVKILGEGKLSKKIEVRSLRLSKSAKEKIEKAGGKILFVSE